MSSEQRKLLKILTICEKLYYIYIIYTFKEMPTLNV